MAPIAVSKPNAFWVQKWLKDHGIDSLLADAVNKAVEGRSKDPAASLSFYFQKRSKRNGEIKSMTARTIYDPHMRPVLEITTKCVFNGGERLGSTAVGPVRVPPPPPPEEGGEPPEDTPQAQEERLNAAYAAAVELINGELGKALVGQHAKKVLEVDDRIEHAALLHDHAPKLMVSIAAAEAGATLSEEPLHIFVARFNKELLDTAAGNIGGGVAVKVGDEEEPTQAEKDAKAEAERKAAEKNKPPSNPGDPDPAPPAELRVRLPAPVFPGISSPGGMEAKVRMTNFQLMGKRDRPYKESLPQLVRVHKKMGELLREKFPDDAAAGAPLDDGSYGCRFETADEVFAFLGEAVGACELSLGDDVTVLLTMSATGFFKENTGEVGSYMYSPEEGADVEADAWPEWVVGLLGKHSCVSAVVDPVAREDYETWRKLRQLMGGGGGAKGAALLGDDIFRNDLDSIRAGVAEGWAAGAVLRHEALGTVTNVADACTLFTGLRPAASRVVLHHREGVQAGAVDADLAIGLGVWGVVCGAPGPLLHGKVNRLIAIEEELRGMQEKGQVEVVSWQQAYQEEVDEEQRMAAAAEAAAQGP